VIALADMPYLNASTIRSVAAGIRDRNSICAPLYGNQRGHPVGFGNAYAEGLLHLSGNEGARRLIAANRDCLELIATQDSGTVSDIDYPQDLNTGMVE
jgi:molybdenum cofactor cytidylyltransferase